MTQLPIQEFLRPLPLSAMVVMGLNDHWWSLQWPGWITGKISDFAVVLFFPALLTASLNLALYGWNVIGKFCRLPIVNDSLTAKKIYTMALLTVLAMVLLNTSTIARDIYVRSLDQIDIFRSGKHLYIVDPTDLWALLVLPLAIFDSLQVVRNHS